MPQGNGPFYIHVYIRSRWYTCFVYHCLSLHDCFSCSYRSEGIATLALLLLIGTPPDCTRGLPTGLLLRRLWGSYEAPLQTVTLTLPPMGEALPTSQQRFAIYRQIVKWNETSKETWYAQTTNTYSTLRCTQGTTSLCLCLSIKYGQNRL